jgi:hypothetical protein
VLGTQNRISSSYVCASRASSSRDLMPAVIIGTNIIVEDADVHAA